VASHAAPRAQSPAQCRQEREQGACPGSSDLAWEKPGDVSCLFSLYLALAISIFLSLNTPHAFPYVV